jgi:hypothetical protein
MLSMLIGAVIGGAVVWRWRHQIAAGLSGASNMMRNPTGDSFRGGAGYGSEWSRSGETAGSGYPGSSGRPGQSGSSEPRRTG